MEKSRRAAEQAEIYKCRRRWNFFGAPRRLRIFEHLRKKYDDNGCDVGPRGIVSDFAKCEQQTRTKLGVSCCNWHIDLFLDVTFDLFQMYEYAARL